MLVTVRKQINGETAEKTILKADLAYYQALGWKEAKKKVQKVSEKKKRSEG